MNATSERQSGAKSGSADQKHLELKSMGLTWRNFLPIDSRIFDRKVTARCDLSDCLTSMNIKYFRPHTGLSLVA
jgi:hypothetical protein